MHMSLHACESVFLCRTRMPTESPQTSHLKHCDGAIGETDVHSHSMNLRLNKQTMADSTPPAGFIEALGPESRLTKHRADK